ALTAILGYSELLSEQIGADPDVGHDLREITTAAQHAAALTKQLLLFSRKRDVALAVVDMNDVVHRTEAMLRPLLGESIRVVAALGDDVYPVKADSTQLEQVIVNLAVNARDAMPRGGTLTIETHNVELGQSYVASHPGAKPGSYVVLSVSDTGTGMPPEVQARIFDPFFTTKDPGRGTGLGLAGVQSIVTRLRGYIAVESELGRGTTFRIYLPRTRRGGADAPKALPASSTETPSGAETILLVEDEAG